MARADHSTVDIERYGLTIPRFQRTKPSDAIQQHLRTQIFSGQLRPGQWIRLEDVANEFGVSTTPVREAVMVLVDEGLLEARTRKGITVLPLSAQDVRDMFTIYAMIMGTIAQRSAMLLTQPELDRLEQLLHRMSTTDHREELLQLAWEFHRIINYATNSRYLRNMAQYVSRNIPRTLLHRLEGWPDTAREHQYQIFDALRRRDTRAARAAAERQMLENGERVIEHLVREGVLDSDEPAPSEHRLISPISRPSVPRKQPRRTV